MVENLSANTEPELDLTVTRTEFLGAFIPGSNQPLSSDALASSELAEQSASSVSSSAAPPSTAVGGTTTVGESDSFLYDDEEDFEELEESPYDLPGEWFVLHSYSGQENKVKINLEGRVKSMHLEEEIFDVQIPMEEVVVIKQGKKATEARKMFPGYLLVRMNYSNESWFAVRDTPGVISFVGAKHDPAPLSRKEVERFLGVAKTEEDSKGPRFKPDWEVGESIRVVTGPFADFNGIIENINLDQSKVTVLVNIFGRDTPTELGFEDIAKS